MELTGFVVLCLNLTIQVIRFPACGSAACDKNKFLQY